MADDYFVSYSFSSGVLTGFGSHVVQIDGIITEDTLTELKTGLEEILRERSHMAEDTNIVILNFQQIGNHYFLEPATGGPPSDEVPEGWVFVPDRIIPRKAALPAALGDFYVKGEDGKKVRIPWDTIRHIHAAIAALYKPASKHIIPAPEKTAQAEDTDAKA